MNDVMPLWLEIIVLTGIMVLFVVLLKITVDHWKKTSRPPKTPKGIVIPPAGYQPRPREVPPWEKETGE